VTLPGFIKPGSYVAEPWKVHTVDPYDYFAKPVRDRLLEKNLRQVAPLGGKIDHDVPGTLSGNWFVEDTYGYAGISQPATPVKPDAQVGYWNTHLAIAPDPLDPSAIIVSFGWFEERCAQLVVKEPFLLPEEVTASTGPVKYELWNWQYLRRETGESWGHPQWIMATDIILVPGYEMHGTVLLRVLEGEHLMMETFPGMFAEEVTGFTGNAAIYER